MLKGTGNKATKLDAGAGKGIELDACAYDCIRVTETPCRVGSRTDEALCLYIHETID